MLTIDKMKRTYKITEEQYNRLCEWEGNQSTSATKGTETVVQTTPEGLSNGTAAKEAQQSKADTIKIDRNSNTVYESVLTKKQLVSEARKDWKKGTKVVKLSELLKK